MSERLWVVNASPLISLAKISQIHILPKLCAQMIIPEAVAQEIKDGPDDDPAKQWLQTSGQQWVKDIGNVSPIISTFPGNLRQIIAEKMKKAPYIVVKSV